MNKAHASRSVQLNIALTEDRQARQIAQAVEASEHFNYLRSKFGPRQARQETAEELAQRIARADDKEAAQILREWEEQDARLVAMTKR